ncbi:hypothetical protein [Vagococcus fluvialis]|uniref:Uncharacterized protein n=1 Tax=Vagococcus fluvialis bH819 TaxID=1255619 RepID=A0A1X6WNZ9_9ENTE|nr:hypothetical protein [Vagococcus fluvialis]SLM85987.1 hypothetical protein FM121_07865 [Vagococcus fluvialis bH819]
MKKDDELLEQEVEKMITEGLDNLSTLKDDSSSDGGKSQELTCDKSALSKNDELLKQEVEKMITKGLDNLSALKDDPLELD